MTIQSFGEPWHLEDAEFARNDADIAMKSSRWWIIDAEWFSVADVRRGVVEQRVPPEINAARIVSCVNALTGLDPSKLAGLIEACEWLTSARAEYSAAADKYVGGGLNGSFEDLTAVADAKLRMAFNSVVDRFAALKGNA